MKSFTKHLLIVCAVCATTGIASHSTAFAANNEDKSSIESSQITTSSSAVISNKDNNSTNTEGSIEDKSISATKDDTSSSEKNTLSSTNTESSAESNEKSKNTYSTNDNETTTTNYSQKVNSDSSNVVTKDNVATTKTWIVKFNQPVTVDSLEGKIELINQTTGAEVPITIEIVPDGLNQSVKITPSDELNSDNEYHLSVSQSITSKFGKVLSNPTIVSFKTQKDISISSINDINLTIKQGGPFTLPATIDATMSDGTTSKVAISWDKQLNSTRSPGNYTFNGTVSGYKNTVKLNLTIEAVPQSPSPTDGKRTQNDTELQLYNYLSDYTNRNSVYDRAVQVHEDVLADGKKYSNNCAFYQGEALRSIGINIPYYTPNTRMLTNTLKNLGWKVATDLSLLLPGDICFTIGASDGTGPTHTYTFMKWVDPSNFHYAYICDNQGGSYTNDGNTDAYHKRSIDTQTSIADKISYFMYPPA
ncbi:Ig-like domain-containing protein [Clostridium tyrobutyricum]|uniref:Ig-like domain-containing protein n=1 Tax=Clostridium tyrobutyricum TaxID=1519 RepID=UPI0039F6FBAA